MAGLEILVKTVQLLAALLSLWKMGGSEVVKDVLSKNHKAVCDEKCQLELKRDAQKLS